MKLYIPSDIKQKHFNTYINKIFVYIYMQYPSFYSLLLFKNRSYQAYKVIFLFKKKLEAYHLFFHLILILILILPEDQFSFESACPE